MKYISYYRVSTRKQEESQLSLIWQKEQVKKFVDKNEGELVQEFYETETGTRKRKRIAIYQALRQCSETGATLLVAKLDRLSRDVEFTYSLLNSKVKFIALDIPGANELTIGVLSVIAQSEAKTIKERLTASIETRKAKGIAMGNPNSLTASNRKKGWLASAEYRSELANILNKQVTGHICDYRSSGWSYYKIAKRINELGHKTTRGNEFSARQVEYLYKRYCPIAA